MRPLWNGTVAFGLVVIPVRLYAATERKSVAFHLLHEVCHTPVKYLKWCPHCGREVPAEELVRAYEYRKGEYVVLTEEEMESIPGPDAHAIEILDFVDLAQVDPVYYEKSFFLEPREGAEKAYALLLSSMKEQGKVALARVAVRAKESLAVVRAYKDRFMLMETMFWADEVRSGEELRIPVQAPLDDREKAMARMLVETLSSDFDPSKYESRQREAISALIERKVQGKETIKEPEPAVAPLDLMEALRKSIEKVSAGEKQPPSRGRQRRVRRAANDDVEARPQ